MHRPPRPFGVTLAVLASLMLFTVFPLMELAILLSVRLHFSNLSFEDSGTEPFAVGVDFLGIPDSTLILHAVVAIVFLVIAFFAWRGKPSMMRYVLMIACVVLTTYNIVRVYLSQVGQYAQGVSSLDTILNSVSIGQFALGILVTLYVVWYLNRGPARAFYRGYYLPLPDKKDVNHNL